MPKRIEPSTAAIVVALILAIALVAVFGDAKLQVAIAGGIAVVAAAFARSLLKAKPDDDDSTPPPPAPGPPAWVVFLVVTSTLRSVTACTPPDKAQEAALGYAAQLGKCAATEPTHSAIAACKARVRADWHVDGGAP